MKTFTNLLFGLVALMAVLQVIMALPNPEAHAEPWQKYGGGGGRFLNVGLIKRGGHGSYGGGYGGYGGGYGGYGGGHGAFKGGFKGGFGGSKGGFGGFKGGFGGFRGGFGGGYGGGRRYGGW